MEETFQKLAILYADVSGSTKIYEKYGDTVARNNIKICLDILSDIAKEHDGKLIKTIGDEAMCSFINPVMAAMAATVMHQALEDAINQGKFSIGEIHVKIGWHYGPVNHRGKEIIGEAPVTAQQIIRLAKADEILTSEQSILTLPDELKENAHCINSLEAEGYKGILNIFNMPWEDTEEVTKFEPACSKNEEVSKLNVLMLEYKGKIIRLDSENTHCRIGRGKENDLSVEGKFTSRLHAEISFKNNTFRLYDISTNGTDIVYADGETTRLRREEIFLSGEGVICFGGLPEEDPDASVDFKCKKITSS
jgi:adenylate cyclase